MGDPLLLTCVKAKDPQIYSLPQYHKGVQSLGFNIGEIFSASPSQVFYKNHVCFLEYIQFASEQKHV